MLRHLLKAHFIHFKKTCFSDKLNGTLKLKKMAMSSYEI